MQNDECSSNFFHSLLHLGLKCSQVYMKPLKDCGLMRPTDNPVGLHPFRPQMIAQELQQHQKRFYGYLSLLGTLARGMLYLVSYLSHRYHEMLMSSIAHGLHAYVL